MRLNEWLSQLTQLAQRYHCPEQVTYITKACRERRAFLFFTPDGWVVLEPRAAPVRHVFVLAAYSDGHDAIARYEPLLFDFAKRIGVSRLRFQAARRGYQRVMPKRGWMMLADGLTWEKENGWRRE